MEYRVKDISLAEEGKRRIDWAEAHMPVLVALRKKYGETKPLKGIKVAGCLHVTKETGVLVRTLKAAGAEITWCGCNPLSTQDDVAASLAKHEGVGVFASRGVSTKEYYDDIHSAMNLNPHVTIDDGADLTVEMHKAMEEGKLKGPLYGGTEETTTGVIRLRAMQKAGKLLFPIIAVNDAETKHDFDNVYGTGQSALDGIIRATNVLLSGKSVVVAGYGHVGKGIARRAAGLGANVIVTEVDPIAALKAKLDGYSVSTMNEAASIGDVFVTTTGCKDVIVADDIAKMKDGAILANAGHFNVEISIPDLEKQSTGHKEVNQHTMQYNLKSGNRVYLIGEGRLVNLAAAEGHPSEVMDMSFANQFLAVLKIAASKGTMKPLVHNIDKAQDQEIAMAKLQAMGVTIDVLTPEQKKYLEGFAEGT
ncbi:MAG: adenosylhomocysteinase [Nitrososphaera sp.]|uniref:adenosylhomocysteinase n=1 Tax=Nitrososphaera sp. TaxID=1971748 RepID=UPI0017CEDEBB|nr:adenosylhomocysteinase [Nitrososphaera sp.]NWG36995.1 adenosylhomocysteinase [Nitrososphaera sp.]